MDKRKLNCDSGARKAMLRNLVTSLLTYDHIVTTEARAKETRRIVERLITTAKANSLHARRMVLRLVTRKETVKRLFQEIAPNYLEKNGGYVRLIKIGPRKGDAAFMTMVELIGMREKKAEATQEAESKETK